MTDTPSDWEPRTLEQATSLYDVAHCRAGDKGDICNIVVVPFDDADYDALVELLTPERVKSHFGELVGGSVDRYPIENVACINFVLHEALDGGHNRSLRLDPHGKTLSRHLEMLPLE
jgi:hypothetical protein